MEETNNVIEVDFYQETTNEEQYRLALESIFRWTWRTDELEAMDIVRAVKRVAGVAMRESV